MVTNWMVVCDTRRGLNVVLRLHIWSRIGFYYSRAKAKSSSVEGFLPSSWRSSKIITQYHVRNSYYDTVRGGLATGSLGQLRPTV